MDVITSQQILSVLNRIAVATESIALSLKEQNGYDMTADAMPGLAANLKIIQTDEIKEMGRRNEFTHNHGDKK